MAIQGLDNILEEFEILLAKANASKAAHPVFLSDLENVREDSLGSFSGWVLLDICAAVEGSCFDEGEYLLLEMTTSEGVLTKLFQVGGDVR